MPFGLRIDATTLPALIFGSVLMVVACILGVIVWRIRRGLDSVVELDDGAILHADRQFRRRIQVSLLLFFIGILIPVGDQMDAVFIQRPLYFFLWVGSIMVLALWMVLMALGDWLSTMTYSEIAKAHLRHERRELEEQVRRYHASKNGEAPEETEEFN
jgi:hypothetical protein